MWLERLLLQRAEKRLSPYRTVAPTVRASQANTYTSYLPQITTLYTKASHWHGTGRYHYEHGPDTRYSNVATDRLCDVLTSILKTDGLQPHQDPWIDSNGKTVSLGTVRMHSRAFACIHATEGELPLYELGSITFWIRFYAALLFMWLITSPWKQRQFIRDTARLSLTKDIQNWACAIRKSEDGKVVSLLATLRGQVPFSDIAGNYPLLFGIAPDTEGLIETIPLTHKVEQRSLKPITISMFTHVEVPLKHVTETQALLTEYNVRLPVIPMEYGDLYLAETPLRDLAFS